MGKIKTVKRTLLALAFIAAAAGPQPARAIVLPDPAPAYCSTDPGALVQMPCTRQAAELQTLHLAMLRSLVPMSCRPVGVRFEIAGMPLSPGRAAGLIATAVVRATSKNARLEQTCEPSHW